MLRSMEDRLGQVLSNARSPARVTEPQPAKFTRDRFNPGTKAKMNIKLGSFLNIIF